jgi:hypothetical protein
LLMEALRERSVTHINGEHKRQHHATIICDLRHVSVLKEAVLHIHVVKMQ